MEGTADRENHPGNTTTHTKDQNKDSVSKNTSELEPPPKKRKVERFDLSTAEAENKWELPEEMATYATKMCNIFLPEKQLQENILDENPIPANISATKEIDSYMKAILHEKGLKQCLSLDKAFSSIQEKIGQVFGPMSTIRDFIEKERENVHAKIAEAENPGEEEKPTSSVEVADKFCALMEMSVTLVGQAFNPKAKYITVHCE